MTQHHGSIWIHMGYPHQSQAQEEGDKHGEGEDKDKVKVVTEPEIAT